MEKFESKGYTKMIFNDNNDANAENPRWYLVLHVVEKDNKTRICHDGESNVKGVCLNNILICSPNLLDLLAAIPLSFCTKKIASIMDISQYFHHQRLRC